MDLFVVALSERLVVYDGYPYSVSRKLTPQKKCRSPPPLFEAGGGPIKKPCVCVCGRGGGVEGGGRKED